MIDLTVVDARGRTASGALRRAAEDVVPTGAAWTTFVAGVGEPGRGEPGVHGIVEGARVDAPQRSGARRARRGVLVGGAAAALLAVVLAGVVVLRHHAGRDGGRPVQPGPTATVDVGPTGPPVRTGPPGTTGVLAVTSPPATVMHATGGAAPADDATTSNPAGLGSAHPLVSVERGGELPAVVAASGQQWGFQVGVSGGPTWSYAAVLALQAPDGRLLIDNAGDGSDLILDPVSGADTQLPAEESDGMRVVSVNDVATIDGVATLLATRAYPCNTEGAQCGGYQPTLIALDGSGSTEVVINVGGVTIPTGERVETVGGRFSLSDTGLVAGVAQLAGTSNVAFLLDSTIGPNPDGPSSIDLGTSLGLNGVATNDPQRRIDAATVDQSGSAIAWLDQVGVTVIDLETRERRTFPLSTRPTNPLPVLDLALVDGSIAAGAVLLSAPNEPAFVIDLTDGSVAEVPDFGGTLTFSAAG